MGRLVILEPQPSGGGESREDLSVGSAPCEILRFAPLDDNFHLSMAPPFTAAEE